MAHSTAVMRSVVQATTRHNTMGSTYWVLTLTCGHVEERLKETWRTHRVKRPTPPTKAQCRLCGDNNQYTDLNPPSTQG